MKRKSFDEKCYDIIKRVPKGKLITYKTIARKLKSKAYRAVGNAMHRNPNAPIVPCHRVVRSNGETGGYALGTAKKIQMLKKEGIEIKNKRVVNLETYLKK